MPSQQSFPVHLLTFVPHLAVTVAVLQEARCEELGLRYFGRSKVDPRKAPAVTTVSATEQHTLIEASVASNVVESRRMLRGPRTQANIMRANDQFELFLHRFKGHPSASWHACTPEPGLTYLRMDVSVGAPEAR